MCYVLFKILLSDSVNKYLRNMLVKIEMKSQGYTSMAGFFWGEASVYVQIAV